MKFNSIFQSSIAVLTLMFVPVHGFAATATEAPYCIATSGGFGNGGSTFVARNFTMPDPNKCSPWTGYTKTSATVIFATSGTACLSGDSTALTVSVSSADPDFLGVGVQAADYIKLSRESKNQPFTGQDVGYEMGSADAVTCTNAVLSLPSTHD